MEVENKTITLSFTPEVSKVSQDTEREFLGMICLKAPTYCSEKRAAITTVAVIDRSGSMSGWQYTCSTIDITRYSFETSKGIFALCHQQPHP
jgi:hypothetical protein